MKLFNSMVRRKTKINEEYEITQEMISAVRDASLNESVLNEKSDDKKEKDEEEDAIAITDDPKFGQNVLQNQIENFRKTVSGGAKFADASDNAEENPLIFYPTSGNLVFSGSIPNIAGLKFQFSLNDVTNAPYIFVDGLALTDDVLNILRKLSGFYKNWRDEWSASTDLLDRLKKKKS